MSEAEEQLKLIEEKRKEVIKYARAMTNTPLDKVVTSSQQAKMFQKYDKDTVYMYLSNPSKYESRLREVIDYLCSISPQFDRLITYVPNMAITSPFLKQNIRSYSDKKKDKIKTDFNKVCDYFDTLDIRNSSTKIIREVFKYGIFYGVEIEGVYSTYIKRLNPNLCKIVTEGELGLGFAFDFSYFNSNEYLLENGYPKEFNQLYKDYKANKKVFPQLGANWQPVPLDISVVVKYDVTNLDYSVPPYVNIFSALYDLEEYQSLNKAKVTAENYTLIGLKIPSLSNATEADSYAISNDMIDATTEQLDGSLPEYMGYFTTATDIVPVKASTSSDSKVDNVANAVANVWNSTGYAESIFGVNNNNSGTLEYSIKTDEQQLFSIYEQLQQHFNLRIKKKNKNFKLIMLKTTWFNIKNWIDWITSSAQVSIPVAQIIPILLGFDISDVDDMNSMQDIIFDIQNSWKPLASSYTQSGNDEGGRPKSESGLSNSGDQTNNNDSNGKR